MVSQADIYSLKEITEIASLQRAQGKVIVLCHGMFDLIHLGHVRHLQAAKNEGDVLIVTVTADKFSRKGPGRPVFSDMLRAEALAAISCVDYVAINHADTAEPVIRDIKPNIFAKGSDYRDSTNDLSGKIRDEQRAVEQEGGRIFFTDEITFSSSNILNRHFGIFPDETNRYLQGLRKEANFEDIADQITGLENLRVLVIGEAIIDRYTFVSPLGQSGKSSALSVRYNYSEDYAGGALAVANHVAAFVKNTSLLTTLGGKGAQGIKDEEFLRGNLNKNITPHLIRYSAAQTIVKERFVDADALSKLFEIYYFEEEPQVSIDEENKVCSWLQNNLENFDAVIVPDYGNGMITHPMIEVICNSSPFLAVNTQVNSGNRGYHVVTRYSKANFVCLNEPELWLATHNRHDASEVLARQILSSLGADYISITQGAKGLFSIHKDKDEPHYIPPLASKVIDRVGAGDAFLSLVSICLASGLPLNVSSFVGGAAAALEVQIVGNSRTIEKPSLLQYISVLLK